MATAAQAHANQANAQYSTGPRTAEGKARSARNHLSHGLAAGLLCLTPEEQIAFDRMEAEFREELEPEHTLEEEAFQQFMEGVWRMHKIRTLVADLFQQHGGDPLIIPQAAAQLNALQRYRAAAEMLILRSIRSLRELQERKLIRTFHLTNEEDPFIPPCAIAPKVVLMGDVPMRVRDRLLFYETFRFSVFSDRFKNQEAPPPDPAVEEVESVETESARAA